MNNLNIYGQPIEHSDSFIIADKAALEDLRDVLDMLINGGYSVADVNGMVSADGEGFSLHIVREDNEDNLRRLKVPYFDEYSKENRSVSEYDEPWMRMKDRKNESKSIQQSSRYGSSSQASSY